MRIESIHIYPIKGMKGSDLETAEVEYRGLKLDRRWMVVDESGLFLSQRKLARMATLEPKLSGGLLTISAPGREDLQFDIDDCTAGRDVTVWKSVVYALGYPPHVDRWISEAMEMACALVRMPEDSIRETNPAFSKPGDHVSFADGFPVTLAALESLKDLNSQLENPISMTRFRPNLVATSTSEPWIEETWRRVRIGDVEFRMVKPCGRCLVTTIDQETGEKTGDEPLRTLAEIRRSQATVDFSVNLIPDSTGTVSVGDPIQVLE